VVQAEGGGGGDNGVVAMVGLVTELPPLPLRLVQNYESEATQLASQYCFVQAVCGDQY